MDEQVILNRLKEIEGLAFSTPKYAKEFLRNLKKEEPEVYKALKLYHEESRKPQFYNGCLIGERVWSVKVCTTGFRLYSFADTTIWPPYEKLEAKCGQKNHVAPTDGCNCGIYGVLPGRKPWFNNGLCGTVALWGKFIEGSLEVYKGQYAYPQSFDSVICSSCHTRRELNECVSFLGFPSQSEFMSFICRSHLRTEGPLTNLHVPATYVVDELKKEYGIDQSENDSDTIEDFIESLNLEGF